LVSFLLPIILPIDIPGFIEDGQRLPEYLLPEMRSISSWFDFRQKIKIETGYEMKAP